MRGRKPKPGALRKSGVEGPTPPDALPRCPDHLSHAAKKEWRRLATPLWRMGVLTVCDRAALAAYCQSYGRWVEAEEKLAGTPPLLRTPSGYVQQSPWLAVANKQLELMGRYMAELGLTPSSRMRVATNGGELGGVNAVKIAFVSPEPMSTEEWTNRYCPNASAAVIDGDASSEPS